MDLELDGLDCIRPEGFKSDHAIENFHKDLDLVTIADYEMESLVLDFVVSDCASVFKCSSRSVERL